MTKIKKIFDICIEICKKEFPERQWWKENLPYICIRELCMRKEWYKNGQLKSEGEYRDNKKEGIHREWCLNNQLQYEGEYMDGKKEGIHRSWYQSHDGSLGQLKYEREYRDGKVEGIHRWWHENGKLEYKRKFMSETDDRRMEKN